MGLFFSKGERPIYMYVHPNLEQSYLVVMYSIKSTTENSHKLGLHKFSQWVNPLDISLGWNKLNESDFLFFFLIHTEAFNWIRD